MRKDEITKLERHIENAITRAPNILQLAYQVQHFTNVCNTLYYANIINYLQFGYFTKLILDKRCETEDQLLKILLLKENKNK